MSANHKPATPLPWTTADGYIKGANGDTSFGSDLYYPWPTEADMPYIVHAANAYPRLVAALKAMTKPDEHGVEFCSPKVTAARALLRELGEA